MGQIIVYLTIYLKNGDGINLFEMEYLESGIDSARVTFDQLKSVADRLIEVDKQIDHLDLTIQRIDESLDDDDQIEIIEEYIPAGQSFK
jgi:hypothetical protein